MTQEQETAPGDAAVGGDVVVPIGGVEVLRCAADGPLLDGERAALDLIGAALGRADAVAVPVARIAPEFFALRSGVAGAVAQKFVNYRLRLVVVGDVSDHVEESTALRDFVRESNRGGQLWFVADEAELAARLRATAPGRVTSRRILTTASGDCRVGVLAVGGKRGGWVRVATVSRWWRGDRRRRRGVEEATRGRGRRRVDRGPVRNDAPVQTVTVVGIGADGWAGLAEPGRAAVRAAEVLLGGPRQLDLVAGHTEADVRPWPSPMLPALPGLFAELADRRVCVLASGDPMFHGIGATLARVLGPDRLHVVPHPSSVSLACARLGWAVDGVEVVSAVARPLARVRRVLAPGARVLVLSEDAATPAAVAGLLVDAGYGASAMTVLARLGAPDERTVQGTARDWVHPPGDPLNVVAVECVADPGAPVRAEVPGLPDDAYDHDGQLTKREVRAVTLAHLGPLPGELLWDVGAGNGSHRDRVAACPPDLPGGRRRERRAAGRPDRRERRGARACRR